jgi:hypothetical protein
VFLLTYSYVLVTTLDVATYTHRKKLNMIVEENFSLPVETPGSWTSPELLAVNINDVKDVRSKAIDNAYKSLRDAFGSKIGQMLKPECEVTDGLTPSVTDAAIKKFLTTENCGLEWISHEGSMIISSLISVTDNGTASINFSQLPEGDRKIVNIVASKVSGRAINLSGFSAEMDEYKDFKCIARFPNYPTIEFALGNRVSSIPPSESSRFGNTSEVKVERKGKDIVIGDRIKIEKNRIQNLVQPTDSTNNGSNRSGNQSKQKVVGRNAFEIRQDIIENAIEIMRMSNPKSSLNIEDMTDDILKISSKLYDFVENKYR